MSALSPTTLALLVRRSLRLHALSTTVTVLSIALACGLVMAVFTVSDQTRRAFTGGAFGFDGVLGARGSQLQLVLNSVFHLETSPGNLPWAAYRSIAADPRVEAAVPFAVGDSYRGFRVVGTTPAFFERISAQVASPGRVFDPAYREVVLGSAVAYSLGIGYGDELHPEHGVAETGGHEHEEEFVVVGVLEPTGSPSDRVVWIPIDGVYRMGGHVLRGSGEDFVPEHGVAIPDEHKEVSAVLLAFRTPRAGFQLDLEINRAGKDYTLAWPIAASMAELFDKLGWVNRVLELVAYLVVVVAAGSILASLYNTMNERRGEFAVLRALGARRRTVFAVLVAEASSVAALGSLLGFAVYFAIFAIAATVVRARTGVVLEGGMAHPALLWTPIGMIVLGALAGVLPAVRAYASDVAAGLANA